MISLIISIAIMICCLAITAAAAQTERQDTALLLLLTSLAVGVVATVHMLTPWP